MDLCYVFFYTFYIVEDYLKIEERDLILIFAANVKSKFAFISLCLSNFVKLSRSVNTSYQNESNFVLIFAVPFYSSA